MTEVVNSAGWREWNAGDARTNHTYYGEYKNTGKGSEGTRVEWAKKISSPVSIETILGSGYKSWVDAKYLS
jgi:pectinesterase